MVYFFLDQETAKNYAFIEIVTLAEEQVIKNFKSVIYFCLHTSSMKVFVCASTSTVSHIKCCRVANFLSALLVSKGLLQCPGYFLSTGNNISTLTLN